MGLLRKLAEVSERRPVSLLVHRILCPENCLSLFPIAMGGGGRVTVVSFAPSLGMPCASKGCNVVSWPNWKLIFRT